MKKILFITGVILILIGIAIQSQMNKRQNTDPIFQNINALSNLEIFYNSLLTNPYVKGLPGDFNTFAINLQDPNKSQVFYNSLKANPNIEGLPDTYNEFADRLGLPIKKKFDLKPATAKDFETKKEKKKWDLPTFTAKDFEDSQTSSNQSVEEVINIYDPMLSTIQLNYRIWLEKENNHVFNNTNLLSPNSVHDRGYIEAQIDHLLNDLDTVKLYLIKLGHVSVVYGKKLSEMLNDDNVIKEFQDKWRAYNEGVTQVMNFDIERIIQFLNVFYFLKNNQSEFSIRNDTIYFLNDKSFRHYNKFLDLINDQKIQIKQHEIRSQTLQVYFDALNLVKNSG